MYDETAERSVWDALPDSLLLEVLLFLSPKDLLVTSAVCVRWYITSRDEILWKQLFARTFNDGRKAEIPEFSVSWFDEFRRLYSETPLVETQILTEHDDEVLYVAFSHDGTLLASGSKDCSAILWDVGEDRVKLRQKLVFQQYNWEYVQFCEFNTDDSLLLVSGVNLKTNHFDFKG